MRRVLFVSPHLDDAVFSCAARILREVASGAEVTVATVFSHVRRGSAQSASYVARRAEDRNALRLLGAKPRWLGLWDAPSRDPFYNSFRRIVFETEPSDANQVDVVREQLRRLVADLAPHTVYLPLAVGTHIDHRLVFAAGSALPSPGTRWFYEDQPYASVRHAVTLRLQEIGAKALASRAVTRKSGAVERDAPMKMAAAFLASFRAAPYVRRHLPAGAERRECEARLRERWLVRPESGIEWNCELEFARAAEQQRIAAAMYAYASQARTFLGTRRQFLASCRRRTRGLGFGDWRVERFWKATSLDAAASVIEWTPTP